MGVMMGLRDQLESTLGNADREIAHAFEIVVDLDGDGDEAEIGGHRLLKREQAMAFSSTSISMLLMRASVVITC